MTEFTAAELRVETTSALEVVRAAAGPTRHGAYVGLDVHKEAIAVAVPLTEGHVQVAVASMIVAAISMPFVCSLSAWRKPFRHLFPLPVLGVFVATLAVITGWPVR